MRCIRSIGIVTAVCIWAFLAGFACVQNGAATSAPDDAIPQAYIDEAQAVQESCLDTPHQRQYYDCECRGARFLDQRLKLGDGIDQSALLLFMQNECKDATFAAGQVYEDCKSSIPPAGQDHEDYCTCLASTYARLYEGDKRPPDSKTFVALGTRAATLCRDPALARKLYGGAR